ncbi:hypothetical protein HYH02_003821 [Chlamydomonas schloesseri]|uniref:Cyclic nucleotide-binding domain-containing protein n=1 Tax=Chlamydomonas schloesseri TaxID=2026947 RepID=A0A835WNR9_9CHLO|nr:hypothetical protein HYH02_003821 [Chlamydomonas schloesseri]|eukprot:KAG2451214.1 hypothetical protein HYH02_003821 [Chlamydomonas schloesseri]
MTATTSISESTGLKEENWLWAAIKSWMPTASAQMRRAPAIVKLQAFFKFSFEQFETEESTLQDAEDETRRFIMDMQDRAQELAADQTDGDGDGDGDGGGNGNGDGGSGSGRPSTQLQQRPGGAEGEAPGNRAAAGADPGSSGGGGGAREGRGEVAIGLSSPESGSPRRWEVDPSGLHEVAASSGSEADRGSESPLAGDQLDSPRGGHHHHHLHLIQRPRRHSGSGSGAGLAAGDSKGEVSADAGARTSASGRRASARSGRDSDVGAASAAAAAGTAAAGRSSTEAEPRVAAGAAAAADADAAAAPPSPPHTSPQPRTPIQRMAEGVLGASRRFSEAAVAAAVPLSAVAHAMAPAAGLVRAVGEELNPKDLIKDVADAATAFGAGPGLKVHYYLAPSVSNYLRIIFLDPVHPNSMFKVLWDFLYLPINTWILLISPLLIVFVDDIRVATSLGRFEFAIDLLCMLDVLMYFRTAILCDDFRVKARRSVIARNYMRTWGALDMLACIPFITLINMHDHGNPFSRGVLAFRLTRLTKLLRMPHIVMSNNVNAYLEAKVFKRKGLVPLLVLLTALFVTMHHMACYYYYVGVVYTQNFTDLGVESWVLAENLQDMEGPARYMVSLYFTMYTFLTVGYGDVAVVNVADKIWAIVTAIMGIVMVGWFMGAVASYLGGTGGMEAELAQKRQDVFQFIRKRRIRSHTARKLRRYHDSCIGRTLGDTDLEVIRGLPRVLRTEVTLTLYADTVKKVPFMQTRPPQFVVDLLLRLKMRLYDKGEFIVHEGEIGREIYFLSVGELRVQREALPEPDGADDGASHHRHATARKSKGVRKNLTMLSRIFKGGPSGVARMHSRHVSAAGSAAAATAAAAASTTATGPLGGPVLPAAMAAFAALGERAATAATTPPATPPGAATPEPAATPPQLTPAATPRQLLLPNAPGSGPVPAPHTTTTFPLEHAASAPVAAAAAAGGGGGKPGGGRRSGKVPRQDVLLNVVSAVSPPVYLPGMVRAAPPKGKVHGRHVVYPVLTPIATIKPGGHFGFSSCLLGLPRLNSVLAAIPSEVLVLVREDVDALIADWPDIFDDEDLQPQVARQRSFCLRERPLTRADSMAALGLDRFEGPRGVVRADTPATATGGDDADALQPPASWQPPSAPPLTLVPPAAAMADMQGNASMAPLAVTPWAGAGAGAGKAPMPASARSLQLPMPPQGGGAGAGGREVKKVATMPVVRSSADGDREGRLSPVSASARVAPAALPPSPKHSRLPAVLIATAGPPVAAVRAGGGGGEGPEVQLSEQQQQQQQQQEKKL